MEPSALPKYSYQSTVSRFITWKQEDIWKRRVKKHCNCSVQNCTVIELHRRMRLCRRCNNKPSATIGTHTVRELDSGYSFCFASSISVHYLSPSPEEGRTEMKDTRNSQQIYLLNIQRDSLVFLWILWRLLQEFTNGKSLSLILYF